MNNTTTTPTIARNWQEIIANLQRFSKMERDRPQNFYYTFLHTAENLQALEQNNASEAEKEAFFKEVEKIYVYFEQHENTIKENRRQEEQFKTYSKLGVNFADLINKQAEQLEEIEKLKEKLEQAENLIRTTAQTTQRNWQEIIANLQEFSEMGQGTIEAAVFLKTAEQLQALMNNNGTEAEKEAFFAPIESIYIRFVQTQTRLKEAMAKDEENAQKLREQQAKIKAENERWKNLPFYVRGDSNSDLICIESRETLADKFCAISCMLDSLKAIPQLLEMGLLEEGKSSVVERLTEMSKLYILFADEQFELLANEIQSGKYGKLDLNGTAKNKGACYA